MIRTANPGPLRRFYRDWYRPDLMAVFAVGDVDPAATERTIRQRFGTLAGAPRARPRPAFAVPPNAAPLVCGINVSVVEPIIGVGPNRFWLRAVAPDGTKSGYSNSVDAPVPFAVPVLRAVGV